MKFKGDIVITDPCYILEVMIMTRNLLTNGLA